MRYDVYVDGSFSTNEPNATYGGFVILINGEAMFRVRIKTKRLEFVSMRNVGGELIATASALTRVTALTSVDEKDSIHIYHDYMGIEKFVHGTQKWKANKPGSNLYVSVFNAMLKEHPEIEVYFHKVKAHTGNVWNEVADGIASGRYSEREDVQVVEV